VQGQLRWTVENFEQLDSLELAPDFRTVSKMRIENVSAGRRMGTLEFIGDQDTILLRSFVLNVRDRALKVYFEAGVYDTDLKMLHLLLTADPDVDIVSDPQEEGIGMAVLMDVRPGETHPFSGRRELLTLIFSGEEDAGAGSLGSFRLPESDALTVMDGDVRKSKSRWSKLPPLRGTGFQTGRGKALLLSGDSGFRVMEFDRERNELWIHGRGLWVWHSSGFQQEYAGLYRDFVLKLADLARRGGEGSGTALKLGEVQGLLGSEVLFPYDSGLRNAGEGMASLQLIIRDTEGRELRRLSEAAPIPEQGYFRYRPEQAGDFSAHLELRLDGELIGLDSSRLHVAKVQPEALYTGLDETALKRAASAHGGIYAHGDSLDAASVQAMLRNIHFSESRDLRPRRSVWFLLLIFAVAVTEWILRKNSGQL